MARNFKPHISTKGKPYKCVGWRGNTPIFVPKTFKELEREGLSQTGCEMADRHKIEVGRIGSGIPVNDEEIRECEEAMNQKPSVIPHTKYVNKTVFGHTLYYGPATSVTVGFDDPDMPTECYIKIIQSRAICNPEIRVGPIKTDLSVLMESHWLEAEFDHRQIRANGARPIRIYLTNGDDRYKMKSVSFVELQENGRQAGQYDLGALIPLKHNMMRAHSRVRPMMPVVQEVSVDRDPFDILSERYPTPDKKKVTLDTLVGNRTIRERLRDHT